jgi:hypothetical protein
VNARKRCDYLLSDTADFDGDGVVDSLDHFPAEASETTDTDGDGFGDNTDPFPSDPSNAGEADWRFCVGEFGVCRPPVPSLVRYGLNDIYVYQQVTGEVDCNNATFGNPVNARKRCDYLLSDTADHDGDGVVDSLDLFPGDVSETVDSDQDGAGDNADPFPNDPANEPDNANWTYCTDEHLTCIVPTQSLVRYGAQGQYIYRIVTDTIACNNATFTDPIGGTFKRCDYLSLANQ